MTPDSDSATTMPIEAADLLHARLCDPRCLLAMESPPGDRKACTCVCGGRWHAALVFAEVLPQPWMCPECGGAPEDCARARQQPEREDLGVRMEIGTRGCCPDCGHTPDVLAYARRFLAAAV